MTPIQMYKLTQDSVWERRLWGKPEHIPKNGLDLLSRIHGQGVRVLVQYWHNIMARFPGPISFSPWIPDLYEKMLYLSKKGGVS